MDPMKDTMDSGWIGRMIDKQRNELQAAREEYRKAVANGEKEAARKLAKLIERLEYFGD